MRLWSGLTRLNLALQGGGAHGAFTWGVLDRLLDEPRPWFDTVSATSAGAVNAVAMLSGLSQGGPAVAKTKLTEVWEAISKAGIPEHLRFHPLLAGWSALAGMLSPYGANPFDLNPLRDLLTRTIDFERLRARPPAKLLIAATEVATGRARLFRASEVSVDVVLASACLPSLQRAVEIDGRFYWDGGFSANPDLRTLAAESRTSDTLVVLLNPTKVDALPKEAKEIAGHANHITFNQPFYRDVEEIDAVRRLVRGVGRWTAGAAARRVAQARFHVIEAASHTAELAPDSKLYPDWQMLVGLRDAGRAEADRWLASGARSLRRRNIDLAKRFLRRSEPRLVNDSLASAPENPR